MKPPRLYRELCDSVEGCLSWLTAYLSLGIQLQQKEYCIGLGCVAYDPGASGCDIIMSACCIPIIVECICHWPADGPEGVVEYACWALYCIAEYGSVSVHTAFNSVPGIQAMLVAAKESGLDDGNASGTLEKLEL
jgi:hypothetical protein